jgi:sortase A
MKKYIRQLNNIYTYRGKGMRKRKNKGRQKNKPRQKLIKYLVYFLEFMAVVLVAYIVLLPFYPAFKYRLNYSQVAQLPLAQEKEIIKEQVAEFKNSLPQAEYAVSPNRVIIPKIGVNAPIIESQSGDWALSQGAWLLPDTSTPDKGGNTVITGHRFKYLPPHNLTFYLFHKLEPGDLVSVVWHEEDYLYEIKETKIVEDTDFSILDQTSEPTLTMFTCHPIYSTEQRLVVVSELIEE